MKRRLPIGIQDFTKIREDGFCYIDKTALIYRLISGSGGAFFLSRPRRFGKSLLCSTLEAIFENKKELFGECSGLPALAIKNLEWEWKQYPVIKFDLNPGNYKEDELNILYEIINIALESCANKYSVPLTGDSVVGRFVRLIETLHNKYNEKVVVIIDEYDKPLLSTIDAPEIHVKMREALKSFYGILKSSDKYLKFVFLTGVSKFSHVSIFSDLNHLVDLTLDPRYADICGLTQEEVEKNFAPEINGILEDTGKDRADYLENLHKFYNGYRFSEKLLSVYNPFGLLNHFDKNGKFLPYWYDTGSPAFLVNLVIKQKINIPGLTDMNVNYEDFRKYDIEDMKAEPLLYQTGYLTIKDFNEELNQYTLDYPNEEVRTSFTNSLMEQYFQSANGVSRDLKTQLPQALLKGDVNFAMNALKSFLASIPYDIIKEKENYYETAIHLIFSMLGFNCRSEARIASGRIDTLVETRQFVYCFEFKLNGSAKEALAQIDKKDYLLPWTGSGKKLFKVGVSFDLKKRNIKEWKVK
jgi:hypothetical protein